MEAKETMSRPKNDYYGYMRKRIMKYPKIKEESTLIALLEVNAIEAELSELRQKPENADRLRAIDLVLFAKTHTIEGAALKLNYHYRTVQNWINEFINKVGHRAGY